MGISKKCCYVCDLLLQQTSSINYRGATGKIFPWALPPWGIPFDIEEEIWTNLKLHIQHVLQDKNFVGEDPFHSRY
jgi:hypothetical protein